MVKQCQQNNRRIVTTNYVLSELIAVFSRLRVPRTKSLNYIEIIRSSTSVDIVHIDQSLDEKAWQLLARRLDKEWSIVDAVSFVVMQERETD